MRSVRQRLPEARDVDRCVRRTLIRRDAPDGPGGRHAGPHDRIHPAGPFQVNGLQEPALLSWTTHSPGKTVPGAPLAPLVPTPGTHLTPGLRPLQGAHLHPPRRRTVMTTPWFPLLVHALAVRAGPDVERETAHRSRPAGFRSVVVLSSLETHLSKIGAAPSAGGDVDGADRRGSVMIATGVSPCRTCG
ncbi:hypothetical protein Mal4_46920 [Maioricimonas rarisocia]|uniref:Uncharacterized protein n=1 Tax=Maioricimonas rarisocia TaxID=2528026 RepID=A0A517ZCW4_9PLAN|nr:hypothetical protein Mal4_46920 [Maioricimonas rarisocia]